MNLYKNINIATANPSANVVFIKHIDDEKLPSGYERFCQNTNDRNFALVVVSTQGIEIVCTTDARHDANRRFDAFRWHREDDDFDYDRAWEEALDRSFQIIDELSYHNPNEGQLVRNDAFSYWKVAIYVNGYPVHDPATVIPACYPQFGWIKEKYSRYMGSVKEIADEAVALLALVQETAKDDFSCSCSICPYKARR